MANEEPSDAVLQTYLDFSIFPFFSVLGVPTFVHNLMIRSSTMPDMLPWCLTCSREIEERFRCLNCLFNDRNQTETRRDGLSSVSSGNSQTRHSFPRRRMSWSSGKEVLLVTKPEPEFPLPWNRFAYWLVIMMNPVKRTISAKPHLTGELKPIVDQLPADDMLGIWHWLTAQ